MSEAVLQEVSGCRQVLVEIRDLLRGAPPPRPTPASPAAPPPRPGSRAKLTSADVAKAANLGRRKNLNKWLARHAELRPFTENQGHGKTLLWDPRVLYWFDSHRDENGRYRD